MCLGSPPTSYPSTRTPTSNLVLNIDKHTLITQGVGAGVAQYLVECMTPYMYGSTILLTTGIRKYLIKNILNSHSS